MFSPALLDPSLPLLYAGSKPATDRAWRDICRFGRYAPAKSRRRSLRRCSTGATDPSVKYITAGLSLNSLSRIASWANKFHRFVESETTRLGHARVPPALVADNDVALRFLAETADEDLGRTRVAAALRALNFVRKLIGVTTLSDDPRIPLLREGVLRLQPHAPTGAVPFPVKLLVAIAQRWGSSSKWWKRMVATVATVAFLSLLRGAGVLSIPSRTVTWVDGLNESRDPPAPGSPVSGALLLVPSRKSSQSSPSWVPIRHGIATELLAAHVRWRRRKAVGNSFLFPSRRLKKLSNRRPVWVPHGSNRLSQASLVSLIRQALVDVCGLSEQQAARFTVHSLRVGGINYYKRIGVSIGMRAKIASHKSLVTSRKYLRLLPIEKLVELSSMADPS